MQSGAQQGGGTTGHGRNPPPPVGSSSPSPSSSSSGVSAPHLGFDSIQQFQQQQQQQQLAIRQSVQQQQLRKANGEDNRLPYQGSGIHGAMGGSSFSTSSTSSSMPMPPLQSARKFIDLSQQGPQNREENQNKGQSLDQHMQNQIQQAYLHYAYQASQQPKSQGNLQSLQQSKPGIFLPSSKDQEIRTNNLKMQELMSIQASALKKSAEHFRHGEKQMEPGQTSGEQRSDLKPAMIGQLMTANMIRPALAPPAQSTPKNISNNQLAMMQLQAMQAWAMENHIDLSLPANANLIAQIIPLWQSRMAANQKQNESSAATVQAQLPVSKQQIMPCPSLHDYQNVNNENSAHAKSHSEVSGQVAPAKSRQTISPASFPNSNNAQLQQIAIQSQDNQVERTTRHPNNNAIGLQAMHPPQNTVSASPSIDSSRVKNTFSAPDALQTQYFRQLQQLNRPTSQPAVSSSEGIVGNFPSPGVSLNPAPQQHMGFTKQQLHVLKAQILAFRRLKRGEGSLPQEVLRAIAPPPLNSQQVFSPLGTPHQDRMATRNIEHMRNSETNDKAQQYMPASKGQNLIKQETSSGEENAPIAVHAHGLATASKEPIRMGSDGKEAQTTGTIIKSEPEVERGSQSVVSAKSDFIAERGKAIQPQGPTPDTSHVKKPSTTSTGPPPRDLGSMRKYHGPLFDFPFFTNRKFDSFGSAAVPNSTISLAIGYDVKDLLFEEGMDVLNKKRTENLKKIGRLLAVNLDRKRIRPDLVLRLQIEERKLRLLDLQARIRDEVDQQQQEIMAMPDRPYRKFVRICERQRVELARQVQLSQKIMREKQLKFVFQWRKKLLEAHWAIRDARTARNRGVAKYHERMLREFSKRKDEDRNRRMEALKNNDVDRYREMLLEQQTNMPGDAAQRYAVLSSFLSQTEDYLHKLGGKITAVKNNQEVEEAAFAASAAARAQGLSEEEVKAAAACAGEEVMIRNRFSEMNAPKENSSVNKYYHLAHAVNERVVRQPSMLRTGTLRDYQLVGLQWMLSLYNNKLNGILADEMGLGKTVQVMALIAYLMEFKGNYGPHLIIVPNAVLVNWKSELNNWLPSVTCIYYVGGKDQRNKLFSQNVSAMKFNVLVTTYEFVMNDKAKLAKVDWKYIIIDEAQRMKDRDSVLARDLDRYRCQRRLLLTGTPLQNDLKELWSLLNLLLPEVFDNCKAFHDWFSKPFQKDASSLSAEDDWLETEKKVIIIHRLHQILEPFMLRRRVEDVEGSLPRKDSIVLRCRMSAVQGSIYDWIKATGSVRLDPEDELQRVRLNPNRQIRAFKNLQNKCMELRKVCNHPLLTYPYLSNYYDDYVVRCCGKLSILDRILVKLHRTGHRVLLFSTMTKLLDVLEEYLQWRRFMYRRIDGGTSLEDRESAIVDFNSPDSEIFIFLLSIRAAGRGLNLQTADTVVIYDPDANPKNEEQAVARAHRIGQKREVKVIYMEAVVHKISSYQKEDELRSGGTVYSEDDLAGKDRYMGSIESLIRSNIQQYKIDMADEVINAGRFDQRTTQEERRMTLETLLHDEERYQETIHDVPSLREVNRMIARCEEEVELFDQMDEDLDWPEEMRYDEIPKWLRAGSREVNSYIAQASKKSSKNGLGGTFGTEPTGEIFSNVSPSQTVRKRGRPRSSVKYSELDDQINYDENGEDFDESSEERIVFASEDEEIREYDDEDFSGAAGDPREDQLEGEGLAGGYEFFKGSEGVRVKHTLEEAMSSGSSSDSRRLTQIITPTISSQKFGSLSALDSRSGSDTKRMPEELEEGEIAVSGDSHMDLQQSGSWIHDRDEGEEEQVLQPTIRRKRSIRLRPRSTSERLEEKSSGEKLFLQHGNLSHLQAQQLHDCEAQLRIDPEYGALKESGTQKQNFPSRRATSSSKPHMTSKPSKLNSFPGLAEDTEFSRETWDGKAIRSVSPVVVGGKMSNGIQRKLKNVLSKLQRAIDKDGHQLAPILTNFWKRNENSSYTRGLDFRRIDHGVDRLDYNNVMDFVSDVQLILKTSAQYCGFSLEVRSDARKLQALFFDLMKATFPDTDFREAMSLVSFSGRGATVSPSLKHATQSKRHKPTDEMEPDSVPAKLLPHGPAPIQEDVRPSRCQPSKLQESRLGSSSGSGREPGPSDEVALRSHPGDLVICKKKRKDRDKSVVKTRPVLVTAPDTRRSGRVSITKDTKQNQQQSGQPPGWTRLSRGTDANGDGTNGGTGGGVEVQWAKPVKKMRTDTGKRRPSHLS